MKWLFKWFVIVHRLVFFYAFIVLKFLMMILVLKETRPLLLLIDLQRGLEYLL